MTDEEIKLLQTLPKRWQAAILKLEIERLQGPPPSPKAKCWTPFLDSLQELNQLKAMLAKISE
jgi:hypothetical protein